MRQNATLLQKTSDNRLMRLAPNLFTRFPRLRSRDTGLVLFLILITVPLFVGVLPIAHYVSIAGGSVSIPMGFGGLGIYRVHRSRPGQPTIFVLRPRRFFGPKHRPGPGNDRGYENTGSMDYPLLPVSVEIYRGERRPSRNPSTCHSERSDAQ